MYHFFKIAASLAIKIYCRKTVAHFDPNLVLDGPTIIACNHPNSFFDAINIAVHYPKPIYFLARGDAFNKPVVAAFLKSLHLIPIYRLSEGKENLSKNTDTFDHCMALLKKNHTILIFSEGICVNEWNLRPLKKGTARLALLACNEGINNLQIIPANINYSGFAQNPKDLAINFNASFTTKDLEKSPEPLFYNAFNKILTVGIVNNMILQKEQTTISVFPDPSTPAKPILKSALAIPALIGFLANYWFYNIVKKAALKKTKNSVFYDSVLFGMLLIFYPMMVFLIAIMGTVLFNYKYGLLLFVAMPLSAWCYKYYKGL